MIRKILFVCAISISTFLSVEGVLLSPARADNVGAAIGGATGMLVAGPVGLFFGLIIGEIYGKPWWGPNQSSLKCWIDTNFHRHCPKFPLN